MSVELSAEFMLRGVELSFDSAEQIKAEGMTLIGTADTPITVDFQHLVKANSVTIAVMSAWYRCASQQNKTIEFVNLSPELRNIIEFSGLTDTLLSRD